MNNFAEPRRRSRWVALLGPSLLAASAMGVLAPAALASNGSGPTLNVEPETQQVAVNVFTNFTLTATTSVPAPGGGSFNIDFEAVGSGIDPDGDTPLTPDYSCNVGPGTNTCRINIPSPVPWSTATVIGWVDRDKADGTCEADRESAGCLPVGGAPVGAGDESLGGGGTHAEPDDTDVIEVDFTDNSHLSLVCTPATQSKPVGQTASVTCTLQDKFGNALSGVAIGGEFIAGANDPDSSGQSNIGAPNEDTTLAASATPFTYSYGGTKVGSDKLCFWVESDASFSPPSDDDADGPAEADGGQCANEANAPQANFTEVVAVTWGNVQPPPCPPNCPPGYNVSVTVQKKPGKPKSGVTVNAGAVSCVTNRSGQCTLANLTGANVAVTNSRGYPCSPPTVSGAANVICSKT